MRKHGRGEGLHCSHRPALPIRCPSPSVAPLFAPFSSDVLMRFDTNANFFSMRNSLPSFDTSFTADTHQQKEQRENQESSVTAFDRHS